MTDHANKSPALGDFCYGKEKRLLTPAQFSFVFAQPDAKIHSPHYTLLVRYNNTENARLGLIVAKKQVRRAHERNRIKRLIRESFRQHNLPEVDLVFIVKKSAQLTENSELQKTLAASWQQLHSKCNKLKAARQSGLQTTV